MRAFEQKKKGTTTSDNFFSPKIQPKLKTGTVGDKYEVEADKVADKVVNKNSSGGLLQSKAEEEVQQKPISDTISTVQKQELKEEQPVQKKDEKEEPVQKKEEEESVQKKDEKEEPVQKKEEEESVQKKDEKEEPVQKKEEEESVQKKDEKEEPIQKKGSKTEVDNNQLESKLNDSKGKGSQLDGTTRHEMESGFGTDFSKIKIHTDSNAVQMNQELGAQAFTNGNDIYFNNGKYNPNSKDGKHLLAHELTHTVQQSGAAKIQKQSKQPTGSKQTTRRRIPVVGGDFSHQLSGTFMTNAGTPSQLIITSRDNRESFTGCNAFEVVVDGIFKATVNSNAKNESVTTTTINIGDLQSGRHTVSLTVSAECSASIHASVFAR